MNDTEAAAYWRKAYAEQVEETDRVRKIAAGAICVLVLACGCRNQLRIELPASAGVEGAFRKAKQLGWQLDENGVGPCSVRCKEAQERELRTLLLRRPA